MSLLQGSRTGDDHSNTMRPGDLRPPGSKENDLYERAMRAVIEGDLPAWCDFLKVHLEGPGEILSPSLSGDTPQPHLVARLSPDRLLHTEYIVKPEADTYFDMFDHRVELMYRYPHSRLTQCAVVLGSERIRMHDDPARGFTLGLRVINLPSVDPDEFLSRPGLAALAPLASGDQATRKRSALAALKVIQRLPRERQSGAREAAFNLAPISLDPSTIDRIRKETGMSLEEVVRFYNRTEIGQEIRNQGVDLGLERGRTEGQDQGMITTLSGVLRSRFGSDSRIPAIATSLVHRAPEIDIAIELISDAVSLDDLLPHRLPFA